MTPLLSMNSITGLLKVAAVGSPPSPLAAVALLLLEPVPAIVVMMFVAAVICLMRCPPKSATKTFPAASIQIPLGLLTGTAVAAPGVLDEAPVPVPANAVTSFAPVNAMRFTVAPMVQYM